MPDRSRSLALCCCLGLWLLIALPCAALARLPADSATPVYDYRVVKTLPHPAHHFTQGLVVDGENLVESSGLYGRSFVTRYPKWSDTVQGLTDGDNPLRPLPSNRFAEGLALLQGKLFLLTWKSGQVLVLDPHTLVTLDSHQIRGEGWGLARFGELLVMSDGSSRMTFRRPEDLSVVRQLQVTESGRPLERLNDLTVAAGLIWANVWYDTDIVAIDPHSGEVRGRLDLAELAAPHLAGKPDHVLNGIAWDATEQALWVTGKYWDKRYLIRVLPPAATATSTNAESAGARPAGD